MRAALDDFARNPDIGQVRVVTSRLRAAARVGGNATRFARIGHMLRRPPIRSPFPHVADHVVEAVTIRWKCSNRRCAPVAGPSVVGEFSMPCVGHCAAVWHEVVAPCELCAVKTSARGELPFSLRRQLLATPCGIGQCVPEAHVHNRMMIEPFNAAARTIWLPPVGAP